LKLFIVGVLRRSSGSKFQTAGPAYEKARSAERRQRRAAIADVGHKLSDR